MFDPLTRPVRCTVELSDTVGKRIGIARLAGLDGLWVQLLPEAGEGLTLSRIVELNSESGPVGPIRAIARISSIDSGLDHRGRPVVSAGLKFVELSDNQRTALRNRLESAHPLVVILGIDAFPEADAISSYRVVRVSGVEEIIRILDHDDVAVLLLGPGLTAKAARSILLRALAEFPGNPTVNILIGVGPDAQLFQEFVDDDRLFYLARGSIGGGGLNSLVRAAVEHFHHKLDETRDIVASNPLLADEVLDFCVRISSQSDLATTAGLLVEAVRTSLKAERSQCLIYDPRRDVLCPGDPTVTQNRAESAASGLVGYVARTKEAVESNRLVDDARYDAEADNPEGSGSDRFIGQPILGSSGELIGVVTAVRSSESEPFSADGREVLEFLAASAGATFGLIMLQTRARAAIQERTRGVLHGTDLYRQEALDAQLGVWDQEGDLLRTSPPWLKRTHLVTLSVLVAGIMYMSLAKVDENATGPVVIRARDKIDVTAATAGLVGSVEVSAGDRVRTGDLLVRFHNPPGTTMLDMPKVRAPEDGLVSDVRVRAGRRVDPGDQVISIVNEAAGYELIALLPGSYATQIQPGMVLVVKLKGYPNSHEEIRIDRVGDEIVGPNEAWRYAGVEGIDAVTAAGPVIVVRSQLRPLKFASGDRLYAYRDGMIGEGQVRVRSAPLIVSLLPGLKDILRK